ncbi:MAG: hypothetical protein AAB410_01105 [Patescibacteria group bacterium]
MVIVLVGVIAVLLAGVIYLLTAKKAVSPTEKENNQQVKNQDEAADWKTYENSNLNFEFQHPSDFMVEDDDYSKDYYKETGKYWYQISLKSQDMETVFAINNPGFGGPSLINKRDNKIVLDGITASYTVGDANPDMFGEDFKKRIVIVQFSQAGNGYYVQFNLPENSSDSMVKKILETFKFTN